MNAEQMMEIAALIATQTGLLIWKMSTLTSEQRDTRRDVDRLRKSHRKMARHIGRIRIKMAGTDKT